MPRKKNQIIDQANIEIPNTVEIPITDQVDIKEVESEIQSQNIVQNIKKISKPKKKITKLIETICGPRTIIVEVDE